MTLRKHGTGRVLSEEGQPVRKTATAEPITPERVAEIEREDEDPAPETPEG